MRYHIQKDKMGYNWVVSGGGIVQAYGGLKSFPTQEDAAEAFQMIAKDLNDDVEIHYTLRETLGLWVVDTPKESSIRFARMYTGKEPALIRTQRTIDFIKGAYE